MDSAAQALLGLSCDSEAVLQGILTTALEIQQKRMDAVCDELRAAFNAMEERVVQVVKDRGTLGDRLPWTLDSPSAEAVGGKGLVSQKIEAKPSLDKGTSGTSLMHIDLQSAESTNGVEGDRMPRSVSTFSKKVVDHRVFCVAMSIFIGLSVVVSVLEEEYAGYQANVSLGLAEPGAWTGAETWFSIAGHTFNVVFLFELALCIS
eukprot:UN4847